jgi:hypothetical protein
MTNIRKSFTYDLADDQYHQTNTLGLSGTMTYTGPSKLYLIVDKTTNKLTGGELSEEIYENGAWNQREVDQYAIEVDCDKDTLVCAIHCTGHLDQSNIVKIQEIIPGQDEPFVRENPPLPDHAYSHTDIEYSPELQEFVKPFPWRRPWISWDNLITSRNVALAASDKLISEDLPATLYSAMLGYRTYLRDFTKTFGAAWNITLVAGGTGFAVGDRIAVSDQQLKANQTIDDIMLTVSEVDSNGAIVNFTASSNRSTHISAATTFTNVYYTTNGAGLNANFTVSKVKLVDPWKVKFPASPL